MYGGNGSELLGIIIGIVIGAIILFIILRELICWYYKINARVDLLREINRKLDALAGNRGSVQSGIVLREQITCKNCGKQTDMSSKFCESCGQPMA
jgi:hypothetical protein